MKLWLIAAFLALASFHVPACAADADIAAACLAKAGADAKPALREACIGALASPCIGDEGARTPADVIACLERETHVWDGRLNAAYRASLAKAAPAAAGSLRSVERAWIVWRDAACAHPYAVFQGTMASPMMADCIMKETGRQALWVELWMENM